MSGFQMASQNQAISCSRLVLTTVTILIPDVRIPDSSEYQTLSVQYSNGKVAWLGGPFKYWAFWTINRLFSVRFPDHHSNTGHKSTIWIPDWFGIQMVTLLTIWIPYTSGIQISGVPDTRCRQRCCVTVSIFLHWRSAAGRSRSWFRAKQFHQHRTWPKQTNSAM